MLERIERARLEALAARERAFHCTENRIREELLKVAELWDELVAEYESLLKLRPRAGGATDT